MISRLAMDCRALLGSRIRRRRYPPRLCESDDEEGDSTENSGVDDDHLSVDPGKAAYWAMPPHLRAGVVQRPMPQPTLAPPPYLQTRSSGSQLTSTVSSHLPGGRQPQSQRDGQLQGDEEPSGSRPPQSQRDDPLRAAGESSSDIPTSISYVAGEEQDDVLMADDEDFALEVVGDSGCVDHILSKEEIPGVTVSPPDPRRRGRGCVTASGENLSHDGQALLMMGTGDGRPVAQSVFQVAGAPRALMSIARICGNGNTAAFDKEKG